MSASELSIWNMLLLVIGALAVLSAQTSLQVGYATIAAEGSDRTASAAALLSYVNSSGVLISETAVASVEPMLTGMMLVDEAGARTGIALVNATSTDAMHDGPHVGAV